MSQKVSRHLAVVVAGIVVASFSVGALAAPSFAIERERHPAITIQRDDQFDTAHGVRSGSGTMADPFIISDWQVPSLRIENTDRHVVIRDNTIANRLVLNWIGDRAHVHGNEIGDLRVNQNVPRTGLPTSGEIAHNTFGSVGQLRHWDGTFEYNLVGSRSNLGARAVNFDGFNGAQFRNNTIYGYMDARLHGHHHSSAFGGSSHQHDGVVHGGIDHTQRYHEVWISRNRIETTAAHGLVYLDTNHAGNDRTAASEREPALNDPHVHHTRMHMWDNRLVGAGIFVNVFNAVDRQKHLEMARGLVDIHANRIELGPDGFWKFRDLNGIEVQKAQYADVRIDGNHVVGSERNDGFFEMFDKNANAGIYLHTLDTSDVEITNNSVSRRGFGVRAEQFTKDVTWVIRGLQTKDVEEAVSSDESVTDSPSS